jgi:hypothetical protein
MFKPKRLTKEGRELALDCGRFILQLQYWTDVKRNDFGYRFGYRHQFGHIMLSYAKLQSDKGLWPHWITLNFPYLS